MNPIVELIVFVVSYGERGLKSFPEKLMSYMCFSQRNPCFDLPFVFLEACKDVITTEHPRLKRLETRDRPLS